MTETSDTAEKNRKTAKKPWRRRAVFLAGALLLCLVSALAVLFASGPVRIPLLGSLLAMQGTRGPVQLSVESASLDFTSPDGIDVIIENARAKISGNAPVNIVLPKVVAPLKTDALLKGQVHFESLNLERPLVNLVLSGGPAKIPEMGPLMEAVDRVSDVVDDQFARRGLRFVRIRDASFELGGSAPRQFEGIDADVLRSQNRTIRVYAKVAGNVSTWSLELVRQAPEGGSFKSIGVVVNGITVAELLGPQASIQPGKGLGIPAAAKIETRLDGDGKFVSSNLVARVENGWFQLGKTLVAFDDAALSLVFQAGLPAIEITRSHVLRGETRIFFTGTIEPGAGDAQDWVIQLESEYPQFGSADVSEAPQMLEGIRVEARFDPEERLVSIDQFVARSGKAAVYAKGTIEITEKGPYLAIAAEAEDIPIALAKQVWPITLVPPARQWVIERIKQGLIERASFSAAVRPPAFNHRDPDAGWSGDDMEAEIAFSDGAVMPFGELPEIRGLRGTLTVENEVLAVAAEGGVATSSNGGEVKIPSSSFEIHNLPLRKGKTARVSALLTGGAKDLGAVVNSAPFLVLDRANLKNDGVSGTGSLDILAAFPLDQKVDISEIDWSATGEFQNFTDRNAIMGHTVEKADVNLNADPDQVAITGKGILDGLKADIDLVVPLKDTGVAAKQDVVVSVTAEKLKEKGVDLTAFLSGDLTLNVAKVSDGQEFNIDLDRAEVTLQALGWKKSKGVPATASFKLVETDEEKYVQDFKLKSEGADVEGSMRLSAAGDLLRASFEKFKLRPEDDTEVDIQRASDGRYDIVFSGQSFDGRGLIRSLSSPGGSKGAGDFSSGARIAASIDRVIGFNNQTLNGFSGKIETGAKGLRSADLSGRINGRSVFEFAVTEQGGSQLATGEFSNTGDTLRFLDMYKRMSGGQGTVYVAMADEDSWAGDFKVRNLRITEDPAIKRIRERNQTARNQGRGATGNGDKEDSAYFDLLDIDFTRNGDIMHISRGALQGNVLGGTVSGSVNLAQQTLNLTGTFVPIYALNNFFAKIPLLGFALGGNSGEGLIGVTYRLSGSVSDPVLSVNPISAIAPGIFRKMFEFQSN
ncbi:AsmA-like C-terminal domain-containing protein [Roseibium aggregatum]|uniref:AsmA-like C-terminal domain-containing protein n=1 Tax=Roseibium aggregatum TaxID=187304 RepID=A0A939ECT3_9HYPH|nr:AsmA-like C-terminal domain-containing protein [Roseibium aggregatum]MBN9670805.1 AsmA-like C-terminal domain-containing protein [Roseibium aggregatum]